MCILGPTASIWTVGPPAMIIGSFKNPYPSPPDTLLYSTQSADQTQTIRTSAISHEPTNFGETIWLASGSELIVGDTSHICMNKIINIGEFDINFEWISKKKHNKSNLR